MSVNNEEKALLAERLTQAVTLAEHVLTCHRQLCVSCVEAAAYFLGEESEMFARAYAWQRFQERQLLERLAEGGFVTLAEAVTAARKVLHRFEGLHEVHDDIV